jgi:uncharacterized damage-inducible protein DinB
MNPYAPFLDGQDPAVVIAATSGELARLLAAIGPKRATDPPAPGKWSPREILCHLADTELVFAYRLRQALAEDHHVIQPFDQDLWARRYASFDADAALAMFSSARGWNLTLIRSLNPADSSRPVTHPERGTMTLWTLVETMGGHDINHLNQIRAIARQSV